MAGKGRVTVVGSKQLLLCLVAVLVWYTSIHNRSDDEFTLMTMSYLPRARLLEGFIETYEHCPGVRTILVVWNGKEGLEDIQYLEKSARVRIRVESSPSMNNRYKPDALIRTRAVLSLDDDLRIPCASLHDAFQEWKKHPERLVGWFPRLVRSNSRDNIRLEYLGEPDTIREEKYNMILTGAAFIDSSMYFSLYWSPKLAHLRALVDSKKNCDDILMNFVAASQTCGVDEDPTCQTVQYLRPLELIDLSHSSGVGISHDEKRFFQAAHVCIRIYNDTFGMPLRINTFSWDVERPKPHCDVNASRLFCSYHGMP